MKLCTVCVIDTRTETMISISGVNFLADMGNGNASMLMKDQVFLNMCFYIKLFQAFIFCPEIT